MAKRHFEPLWWLLFSAGGVCFGLLLPAIILWFGVLLPLGVWPEAFSFRAVQTYLGGWWAWLVALLVLVLPVFHAAHRVRHGLTDLKLGHAPWTRWSTYGSAGLLALVVIVLVLTGCGFERDDFRPYEGVIINSVVGQGGDLEPRSKEIRRGQRAEFQVVPATNHAVEEISGCQGELQSNLIYQTGRVQADCTIRVSFTQTESSEGNPFQTLAAHVTASPARF